MPAPRHRLIETEWPDFGPEPLAAPPVPPQEFAARLDRLRARMEERRLSHLLVYGDREHFANLAWLTNFDPRFEEALLILRADGSHPLLVVGNECESYLPISPLWKSGALRAERYQPFSLLDQPRDASRSLQDILRSEGIGAGAAVGCAGWKYYGDPHRMDTPSYIVDTVRDLAGADMAVDATDLFVHPGYGVRSTCSASEIRERYPATWARCQTRRRFVEATLSVEYPPELLPLSDMACLVPPYLLRPNTVLALER
jgi:hypothetical protein